jgi:hypothetical protein
VPLPKLRGDPSQQEGRSFRHGGHEGEADIYIEPGRIAGVPNPKTGRELEPPPDIRGRLRERFDPDYEPRYRTLPHSQDPRHDKFNPGTPPPAYPPPDHEWFHEADPDWVENAPARSHGKSLGSMEDHRIQVVEMVMVPQVGVWESWFGDMDSGSSAGSNSDGAGETPGAAGSGSEPNFGGGPTTAVQGTGGDFVDRRMADAALGSPGGAPEPGGGGGLARARTPWHSTQRSETPAGKTWAGSHFPQASGRAKTPWHDQHPSFHPGFTGEHAAPGPVGRGRGATAAAAADEWRKAGMSESGIAGVFANIQDESGFKPGMRERNPTGAARRLGGGHGLYQFTGPEWNRYQSWLKANHPGADWTNPRLQTRFVAESIKAGRNVPRGLWGQLKGGTKEQAAQAFVRGYERPRADLRQRREARYARGVPGVEHYTGGATAPTSGSTPTGAAGGGIGAPGRRGEGGSPGQTGTPSPAGVINATVTGERYPGRALQRYGYLTTPQGHRYPFLTGGGGRGAAPYGYYSMGGREIHPKLHGSSYPLSNKYDPRIGATRGALFLHRADRGATLGCIGVPSKYFDALERDISSGHVKGIRLEKSQQK